MSHIFQRSATINRNERKSSDLYPGWRYHQLSFQLSDQVDHRFETHARDYPSSRMGSHTSEEEINHLVHTALNRSRRTTGSISSSRSGDMSVKNALKSPLSDKSEDDSFFSARAMDEDKEFAYLGTMSAGNFSIQPSMSEFTYASATTFPSIHSSDVDAFMKRLEDELENAFEDADRRMAATSITSKSIDADPILRRVEDEIFVAQKAAQDANRRLTEIASKTLLSSTSNLSLDSKLTRDPSSIRFDSAIIFGKEYATHKFETNSSAVEVIRISSEDEREYDDRQDTEEIADTLLDSQSREESLFHSNWRRPKQHLDCIDLTDVDGDHSSSTDTYFYRRRGNPFPRVTMATYNTAEELFIDVKKRVDGLSEAFHEANKNNHELASEASRLLGLSEDRRAQLTKIFRRWEANQENEEAEVSEGVTDSIYERFVSKFGTISENAKSAVGPIASVHGLKDLQGYLNGQAQSPKPFSLVLSEADETQENSLENTVQMVPLAPHDIIDCSKEQNENTEETISSAHHDMIYCDGDGEQNTSILVSTDDEDTEKDHQKPKEDLTEDSISMFGFEEISKRFQSIMENDDLKNVQSSFDSRRNLVDLASSTMSGETTEKSTLMIEEEGIEMGFGESTVAISSAHHDMIYCDGEQNEVSDTRKTVRPRSILIPPVRPGGLEKLEMLPTLLSGFLSPKPDNTSILVSTDDEDTEKDHQKPKEDLTEDSISMFGFEEISKRFQSIMENDDLKNVQSSFDSRRNLVDLASSTMSGETTEKSTLMIEEEGIEMEISKSWEISNVQDVLKSEDSENSLEEAESRRNSKESPSYYEALLHEALGDTTDLTKLRSESLDEALDEALDEILDEALDSSQDGLQGNEEATQDLSKSRKGKVDQDTGIHTNSTSADEVAEEFNEITFDQLDAKEQRKRPNESHKNQPTIIKRNTSNASRRVRFKQRFPMPRLVPSAKSPEEIINDYKSRDPKNDTNMIKPQNDLKKLIDSIFDPPIGRRFNACGALKMLTICNKKNQLRLARTEGFLDALIFAAKPTGEDNETVCGTRNRALCSILNLSMPKDNRELMFSYPGLVECLVTCALEGMDETRMLACSVIAMLAKMESCREPLTKVDKLLDALAMTLEKERKKQHNIDVESGEEREDIDDASDYGSTLFDNMSKISSDSWLTFSVASTDSFSAFSEGFSNYTFSDDGTFESYLSSESNNTSDSHSLESTRQPKSDETEGKASATACAALLHLSKQCGAAYTMCTKQNLLHAILVISQESKNPLHSRCLEILGNLSKFPENNEIMAMHPDLIAKLVESAKSDIDEDRVWSLRTLQNISASTSGKNMMIRKYTLELLSSSALRSQHLEEQSAALSALHNLSTEAGCLVALTNTKDVVAALIHIAHEPNTPSPLRLIACATLTMLGLWIQTLAGAGTVPPAIEETPLPTFVSTGWKRFD